MYFPCSGHLSSKSFKVCFFGCFLAFPMQDFCSSIICLLSVPVTNGLVLSLSWVVLQCRQYQDGQHYSLYFLTLFFPVQLKADCWEEWERNIKEGKEIDIYCLTLLFGCLASVITGKVWRESPFLRCLKHSMKHSGMRWRKHCCWSRHQLPFLLRCYYMYSV